MQLTLDAVDRLDQVLLIAARESHARDGMLNFNQRLMYCGLLTPIHVAEFDAVCPGAASPARAQKSKGPRPCGRGPPKSAQANSYLAAGAAAGVEVDLCDLL